MESTNGKRSRRNRLRSRITRKQRSKAEILHQRACLEFASSIYHRFAENLSLRHTDTRFFNAALSIFGGHTPEAAQARLDDTLRFRPRAQHHTDENSTAENADHAQSEGAVASSLITNIDLAAEGISMDKVESDAESTGSKSDSGFGSDTEKKQDLVIEQTPVYQFLEVVLQDIEAAGYIPPEWTSRYVNPDRAALIPATSADVMPTMSTRKASPLVRWTRHAEDAQRVFSKSRMPVVDDRGQSGSSRYQQ